MHYDDTPSERIFQVESVENTPMDRLRIIVTLMEEADDNERMAIMGYLGHLYQIPPH